MMVAAISRSEIALVWRADCLEGVSPVDWHGSGVEGERCEDVHQWGVGCLEMVFCLHAAMGPECLERPAGWVWVLLRCWSS